ncbi:hypothetical protein LguiA_030104 [Lonicera macranthoides]
MKLNKVTFLIVFIIFLLSATAVTSGGMSTITQTRCSADGKCITICYGLGGVRGCDPKNDGLP